MPAVRAHKRNAQGGVNFARNVFLGMILASLLIAVIKWKELIIPGNFDLQAPGDMLRWLEQEGNHSELTVPAASDIRIRGTADAATRAASETIVIPTTVAPSGANADLATSAPVSVKILETTQSPSSILATTQGLQALGTQEDRQEKEFETPYALQSKGVAGPTEVWNVGNANGKGEKACYFAVLADSRCTKDYFSYVTRGDKNCGCKGGAGELSVRGDDGADIYIIHALDQGVESIQSENPLSHEPESIQEDSILQSPEFVQGERKSLQPPTSQVAAPSNTTIKQLLGCTNCCNDGKVNGPCFDVEACAVNAPMGGKYGFIYAQVGRPGWPWLTFIDSLRAQGLALAAETGGTFDIVVLMPAEDIASLSCRQRVMVKQYGIRLIKVPWTIPPNSWYPKAYWWPGKKDGWCGPQDLMRLHALGLDEYDSVVFYDQDIEFQGDMRPVLRCAAKGYFIGASGGVGEPFNVGFFAVRPDRRLLKAAEFFGGNVTFTVERGWGNCGHAPAGDKFVGAECGQGFFHTLMYKPKCKPVKQALAAAGALDAEGNLLVKAVMIDRCIWNYQQDGDCGGNRRFNCSVIRVHHKPTSKPQDSRTCGKFRFHKGGWSGPPLEHPFPMPGPLASDASGNTLCQPQCVSIGQNCICSKPPPRHIKNVTVQGEIVRCQDKTFSNSGDRFSVKVSSKSKLTITRLDAHDCWCDDIDVECCIAPHSKQ
eukprot:TRINITY_DN32087_c0_g1_i1.p1 TRINITY_DN32087_c0_g1~~TRINITY_DN32087_c0_g1_i1.p1  ORF type:complete len:712 (-),score=69.22 TRINITY_DN32087_c0_g1_i1:124-2259(-)